MPCRHQDFPLLAISRKFSKLSEATAKALAGFYRPRLCRITNNRSRRQERVRKRSAQDANLHLDRKAAAIMLNIRSVASAAIVRDKATPQAAVTVAARR